MNTFRAVLHDAGELTKFRIVLLSLMMASLGFCLGSDGHIAFGTLCATLLGLALIGSACGIFNEYLERDIDACMWRTMNRPLPSGRITPAAALILGIISGILGELVLFFAVNPVTAFLGITTFVFYIGIYTPMKRVSSMSTLIGAIPGAMPPLMGWTAAYGSVAMLGMLLFAILFLWQIPHFLAIAWLYREDYARANLPILSVIDEKGVATAKQVILYSVALLPLTLVPSVWGVTGKLYFIGAMALGFVFLASGVSLALNRTKQYARIMFFVSILYLPALGFLMVWDRV